MGCNSGEMGRWWPPHAIPTRLGLASWAVHVQPTGGAAALAPLALLLGAGTEIELRWGCGGAIVCCMRPAIPGMPLPLPWERSKVWEGTGGDAAAAPCGTLRPCLPAHTPYGLFK